MNDHAQWTVARGRQPKSDNPVTPEERLDTMLSSVFAAISNMEQESRTTRLTAIQLSVISRKREYEDAKRVLMPERRKSGPKPRGANVSEP